MKPEKDTKGFWRGALGFIINNWGLKILAFILAVVIYYATKPAEDPSTIPSERIKFEKMDSGD